MQTCAALTVLLTAPAASAQDAGAALVTSDAGGTYRELNKYLWQTAFASTAGGFAVGSTSPNFGGSTMATASSTGYLHRADVGLYQDFFLPAFVTSAQITLDFKGQAFAIGNAGAYIGYAITKFTSDGAFKVHSGGATSTELAGLGGTAGSVNLSARHTFELLGGESFTVFTRSIAETGYTDGVINFFTYTAGPGYATAFMDPIVTVLAAVPEPTTWALLIAGFGMVGIGARRRRPATAAC